jgi:protein-tyrosine kinase
MSSIEKAMARMSNKTKEAKQPDSLKSDIRKTKPNVSSDSLHRNASNAIDKGETRICKLDFRELQLKGYLTPDIAGRKIADEYRAIKRPLLANALGKSVEKIDNGNMIMVVSALPAEGKTYTSFNLAMSIAMEKNNTVLLVDGDIIKPSLTSMLGLNDLPGLTDLLLDQKITLADIIVKTSMPKLTVIPAGSAHMHSTELLASLEMERIAHELAKRYPDRIVVFDAPPILVTTEAPVLTRLAGQILVVVEAGRTEQNLVKEALAQLDSTKVIGMVLNKSRGKLGESRYGSGYGYYGSYGN